jgi:transcription elongation factor
VDARQRLGLRRRPVERLGQLATQVVEQPGTALEVLTGGARQRERLVDRVSAQRQTADLIALNRRVEIDAVTPARAATGW